jgi:hypothetical protein
MDDEISDLESAVRADLIRWQLAGTSLGAAALDLARRLGVEDLRPAAAAMLHAQLNKHLGDLRKLAPPEVLNDEVDELATAREQRRKAAGMA